MARTRVATAAAVAMASVIAATSLLLSATAVSPAVVIPPPAQTRSQTHTFLAPDDATTHFADVTLVMETPTKASGQALAVAPTTPAEQGYIHFYSSVVQFNASDYRLYYFSKGPFGYLTHVAMADTPVGPWRKPSLGLFGVGPDNSTANNVVHVGNPPVVSVFIDDAPGVPASERVKGVSGTAVLVSPDGFQWSPTSPAVSVGWPHFADTQPVVFYDGATAQYVASGRIDGDWPAAPLGSGDAGAPACISHAYPGATPGPGTAARRSLGAAVAAALTNGSFPSTTEVLGAAQTRVGSGDSACVDLYTNQMVRYEDVFLVFPSAYYHWPSTDPPNAPPASGGKGNDGVLAVRLAAARSPTAPFTFVDPAEPAAEWIPRGAGQFVPGDWRFVGAWDAGHVFMTRGLLQHTSAAALAAGRTEWDTVVAYHHGSQLTHGGVDEWWVPGYHNGSAVAQPLLSGIGRLEFRRDGFASLRLARGAATGNASVTIVLPRCTSVGTGVSAPADVANDRTHRRASDPRQQQQLQLLVNADVGVGGALEVALNATGFSRADADAWVGNAVRRAATWRGGDADLSALGGAAVVVTFHLVHAARLYAFELRCV